MPKKIPAAAAFDQAWKKFHAQNIAIETPPEGSITALQYSALNGVSISKATTLLIARSDSGQLETGLFRVADRHGYTRLQRHWWKKKE